MYADKIDQLMDALKHAPDALTNDQIDLASKIVHGLTVLRGSRHGPAQLGVMAATLGVQVTGDAEADVYIVLYSMFTAAEKKVFDTINIVC